jgi:2-polyprenyl-3-methyl-5-hydroxy-6-metoxy-1,4-benzoquinol methylase
MNCCPYDLETEFDERVVARDLEAYRSRGLPAVTRRLLDALVAEGVEGRTLLDIGGGVGAIHHGLLRAGLASVTDVDGSSTYLSAAREEAQRQGHADRISYRHGDFVQLADEVEPADIVTLIGVLCCYPHMESLVRVSAVRARHLYGLVYPRSTWWMHAAAAAFGALRPLLGAGPGFVHAERDVDATVREAHLVPLLQTSSSYWRVELYRRPDRPALA